jgi:hypothetical protein
MTHQSETKKKIRQQHAKQRNRVAQQPVRHVVLWMNDQLIMAYGKPASTDRPLRRSLGSTAEINEALAIFQTYLLLRKVPEAECQIRPMNYFEQAPDPEMVLYAFISRERFDVVREQALRLGLYCKRIAGMIPPPPAELFASLTPLPKNSEEKEQQKGSQEDGGISQH